MAIWVSTFLQVGFQCNSWGMENKYGEEKERLRLSKKDEINNLLMKVEFLKSKHEEKGKKLRLSRKDKIDNLKQPKLKGQLQYKKWLIKKGLEEPNLSNALNALKHIQKHVKWEEREKQRNLPNNSPLYADFSSTPIIVQPSLQEVTTKSERKFKWEEDHNTNNLKLENEKCSFLKELNECENYFGRAHQKGKADPSIQHRSTEYDYYQVIAPALSITAGCPACEKAYFDVRMILRHQTYQFKNPNDEQELEKKKELIFNILLQKEKMEETELKYKQSILEHTQMIEKMSMSMNMSMSMIMEKSSTRNFTKFIDGGLFSLFSSFLYDGGKLKPKRGSGGSGGGSGLQIQNLDKTSEN
jgi:hypothetical protein